MINDEQMDYFHAIGAKLRPKPDNLKLMIVAGAAFFSAIILTVLLSAFYWNGDWHGIKTVNGEVIKHDDHSTNNHTTDPADSHRAPSEKPAESHH